MHLIFLILIIIFGLVILYQIILKILGGSWEIENIIITVLLFNVGFTIAIALKMITFSTDYNYFKKHMYSFVKDFKNFKDNFNKFKINISEGLKEIKDKL